MVKLKILTARVFLVSLLVLIGGCAGAQSPHTDASEPVAYEHIVRHDPNFSIHVVKIDLKDPRVSMRVSRGGPDPDGNGPWLTTLMPTSEIAAREKFDLAINGDFFDVEATKDIEGRNTGYVRGKSAAPVGTAMTDGVLWHQAARARPYLEFTTAKVAKILDGEQPIGPAAREIVGGSNIIVRDGRAVLFEGAFATNRHPRTVVGIDSSGTQLTFFVVDGREPQLSIGMTLAELSDEMIRLGCTTAINLDGGGSTTLVWRSAETKKLVVLNSPSDTKERSVADVLGVTVNGALPKIK
jgi:exopolysaccharide biosynthesis protein